MRSGELAILIFNILNIVFLDITFVEQNIGKSVNDLFKSFDVFLKDTKPEFKSKLGAVTKEIVDEIKKSCRDDIASVNKVIKDRLSIPENVLLVYDSLLATESTQADVDVCVEECQQLEKNVLEVKLSSSL